MNLYHISQNVVTGYDTFSDAVVAAENEIEASRIFPTREPGGGSYYRYDVETDTFHWWTNIGTSKEQYDPRDLPNTWCFKPEQVVVRLIGTALEGTKKGCVCASFHAG